MTSDGRLGGIAVQYGETGLPRRTMGPPGSGITTTEYSYLADGTRLGVAQNKGTNSSPTYYGYLNAGSLNVLHNGASVVFESSAYEAGVIYSHGLMYFTRDHLGNTRVVTDGSGNVVERNDYYPFGERHSDSSMPTVNSNRWRFAGKEIQPLGGTGWLDFGARQYDSFLGRWTTVDPLAEKYPGISPYSYCAGNPINFVDPDGCSWEPKYDNNGSITGYQWIPESSSYNSDGTLKSGLYEQAIYFSDNSTFDSKSKFNIGSSTAYVYLKDGQIQEFAACTVPSDEKYAMVPAGQYEALVGTHNGSSSSYTALKMFDVGKNLKNNTIHLDHPNPAHPNLNYIQGADIHKAGLNNLTGMTRDGNAISKACFLIDRSRWDEFMTLFVPNVKISIGLERK